MRAKFLLLSIISMFLCVATCLGQNTLNIHQKNGGLVSYGFAEKPAVTYTGEYLHVTTNHVTIDYPWADVEMLTFDDSEATTTELRMEGLTGPVYIYRLNGTLMKRQEPSEGTSAIDIQGLPAGTYIIKQGNITYKIQKQ